MFASMIVIRDEALFHDRAELLNGSRGREYRWCLELTLRAEAFSLILPKCNELFTST